MGRENESEPTKPIYFQSMHTIHFNYKKFYVAVQVDFCIVPQVGQITIVLHHYILLLP